MQLEQNFFTLLNLPGAFSIDAAQLKQSARALLRQYHPDRYANATPQEQRLAVQFSAHVNHAVATLSDPVKRALHLLELRGVAIDPQQVTIKDRHFLLEQMEIREAVAEAAGDAAQAAKVLAGIEQRFVAEQQQFDSLWLAQPEGALSQEQADALAERVLRMQFYSNLLAELREKAPASPLRA